MSEENLEEGKKILLDLARRKKWKITENGKSRVFQASDLNNIKLL